MTKHPARLFDSRGARQVGFVMIPARKEFWPDIIRVNGKLYVYKDFTTTPRWQADYTEASIIDIPAEDIVV
jgi:hypothetical protein